MTILPRSLSCFKLHCHVCLGISMTFPLYYGDKAKAKTPHLPGYPLLRALGEGWGGGGWGGDGAWLQMTSA